MQSSKYKDLIIKIDSKKYWELMRQIYDEKFVDEWYDLSQDEMDLRWLGLRIFIPNFDENFNFSLNHNEKCFKIVDKKVYAWAKIKYNI